MPSAALQEKLQAVIASMLAKHRCVAAGGVSLTDEKKGADPDGPAPDQLKTTALSRARRAAQVPAAAAVAAEAAGTSPSRRSRCRPGRSASPVGAAEEAAAAAEEALPRPDHRSSAGGPPTHHCSSDRCGRFLHNLRRS